MKNSSHLRTRALTEGALFVGLAFLLGYVKLWQLPSGGSLTPAMAASILPDRATLGLVWKYLASCQVPMLQETPMCLCRKIVRWSGTPLSLGSLLLCLDIFADVGLLQTQRLRKHITIRLTPGQNKADLNTSRTMQKLLQLKES